MIQSIWTAVLYQPLLNALALLVAVVPGGDVGIAVVLLTIIVKLLLFPLSQKSIESQAEMNILAPELNKIKQSGLSKEEQAKQTFDLYKKHKVNPFSGCLLMMIQIPVIFALYYVFLRGINFDGELIYSFINAPEHANMMFLGLIDITVSKSLLFAVLAGFSQFLQAVFMPKPTISSPSLGKNQPSFSEAFSKSMGAQMKYVFPFIIAFISYQLSGAVALYWITSNLFMVGQQIYVKREKNFKTVIK